MKIVGGVVGGLCVIAAVLVGVSVAGPAVASAYVPDIQQQRVARMKATLAQSETTVIGRSVQGRPIISRCYGERNAAHRAVVIGQMHGSEPAGISVAKKIERAGAPAGVRLCVIRTVNPDGAARKSRTNAHGVDPNRNSPHLWSPEVPDRDHNPGASANSEPETRTYVDFLNALDPTVVIIYHQAGNGVDSYGAKNMALVRGLAQHMGLKVRSFDCDGECHGTLTGWFNSTHAGSAVTVELPSSNQITVVKINKWSRAARWAMEQG